MKEERYRTRNELGYQHEWMVFLLTYEMAKSTHFGNSRRIYNFAFQGSLELLVSNSFPTVHRVLISIRTMSTKIRIVPSTFYTLMEKQITRGWQLGFVTWIRSGVRRDLEVDCDAGSQDGYMELALEQPGFEPCGSTWSGFLLQLSVTRSVIPGWLVAQMQNLRYRGNVCTGGWLFRYTDFSAAGRPPPQPRCSRVNYPEQGSWWRWSPGLNLLGLLPALRWEELGRPFKNHHHFSLPLGLCLCVILKKSPASLLFKKIDPFLVFW